MKLAVGHRHIDNLFYFFLGKNDDVCLGLFERLKPIVKIRRQFSILAVFLDLAESCVVSIDGIVFQAFLLESQEEFLHIFLGKLFVFEIVIDNAKSAHAMAHGFGGQALLDGYK